MAESLRIPVREPRKPKIPRLAVHDIIALALARHPAVSPEIEHDAAFWDGVA